MKLLFLICIVYLTVINLAGFLVMGIDKQKAKKNQWRIKEKTLFTFAIIGGSVGSILGMFLFHHKTKHYRFMIGMPAILIIQVILIIFLLTL
ncbi:DUF1294 domain-containing protein [Anaerocolumna sedimenticola]|uniref:DUF1294 domain-containing protein n=1 Tax=Anaerocolumna sedimenticola TaxID=2696063 RepID=A0A6P1TLB8_9FIRM|nr:DUF1294 domain-containing protein [Anaerocolumna sedimenticola]QHQ61213.1 DUF1294 domain-containing protein [Anaerocolumna sedimenticola]